MQSSNWYHINLFVIRCCTDTAKLILHLVSNPHGSTASKLQIKQLNTSTSSFWSLNSFILSLLIIFMRLSDVVATDVAPSSCPAPLIGPESASILVVLLALKPSCYTWHLPAFSAHHPTSPTCPPYSCFSRSIRLHLDHLGGVSVKTDPGLNAKATEQPSNL